MSHPTPSLDKIVRPSLSPSDRLALNTKWAALRRSTPDPGARDAIPQWQHRLISTLAYIPYSTILIFYVPYLTLRHIYHKTTGQTWSKWTLPRMLTTRMRKLWGRLMAPCPLEPPCDAFTRTPEAANRYTALKEGKGYEIERVVLPRLDEIYRVGFGVNEHVEMEEVVAYWVRPGESALRGEEGAEEGEKVVLHIHGGGYLGGHPIANHLAVEVAVASQTPVLAMSYRKPLNAHTAFPAPLLDVLTGYVHLLSKSYHPKNITLLGKSAGGHLCLMLLRYINDLQLPLPGSLGMMAPWCDLDLGFPSYQRNGMWDTLCMPQLAVAVRSARRWYSPEASGMGYFDPARAGRKGEGWEWMEGVRVYIMFGTREMFEDEILELVRDMRDAGVRVEVREDPNGLHTSPLYDTEAMAVFAQDMSRLLAGRDVLS